MIRLIQTGLLLLMLASLWWIYFMYGKDNIYYINVNEVYEAFDAKIERQLELDFMREKQLNVIDSLESELFELINIYEIDPTPVLEKKILIKQKNVERVYEEFEAINQEQLNKFFNEITLQMNRFIKVYGEENKIKFILGANGNGSIMYADEKNNITKEVIVFINKLYHGE